MLLPSGLRLGLAEMIAVASLLVSGSISQSDFLVYFTIIRPYRCDYMVVAVCLLLKSVLCIGLDIRSEYCLAIGR